MSLTPKPSHTRRWLETRRRLRDVRAWEGKHGELTAEEIAAADRSLDEAGVGRR